jgi:hypothetical protein
LRTTPATDKTFVRLLAQEKQHKKKSVITVASVLLFLGLLVGWYVIASDYSYQAVVGIYTLKTKDANSTLILREDRTFEQTLDEHGIHKSSQGTWSRIGDGGVVFSNEFLTLPRQEPVASGEVYGAVEKAFGLFTSIHIRHNANVPVYKKLFLSNALIE